MKSNNKMYSLDPNFVDTEWEQAENLPNEKELYYKVYALNGGIIYKVYKPSVAELIKKRQGVKMEIIG